MKKILVLFGAFALIPSMSFAYMDEDQTASIDELRNQGYSETTLQLVDLAQDRDKGPNSKYERRFVPKGHKNIIGKSYSFLNNYFNPIYEDGIFGEHQVNFTNTWSGENSFYSSPLKDSQLENL